MSPSGPRQQTADAAVHSAVVQAVHRSWWNVDLEFGVGSELLYTEDGVCEMPALTMTGRAEIIRGYAARQAAGPRSSRHLVSNTVVDSLSDERASAMYIVTLHAHNGLPPLPLHSPSAICDVVDHFVRDGGEWLIERRVLDAIFVAAENDSVLLGNR